MATIKPDCICNLNEYYAGVESRLRDDSELEAGSIYSMMIRLERDTAIKSVQINEIAHKAYISGLYIVRLALLDYDFQVEKNIKIKLQDGYVHGVRLVVPVPVDGTDGCLYYRKKSAYLKEYFDDEFDPEFEVAARATHDSRG